MLPVIAGHVPAGSSVKQLLHFAQLIKSGKFQMYDHGPLKNLKLYGHLIPPEYDLNKVTTPVAVVYGANDLSTHVKDMEYLYQKLKNPMGKYLVVWPKWSHQDYLYAIDVDKYVYEPIMKKLDTL